MLQPRVLGEIPAGVKEWGEALLAPTDVYRVLGEQLADLVRDEEFAGLYEPTGRQAISPALLALVTLFQYQEQLPDRAAAQMVRARLDWKYALHLALEDPGFDFSDLCHFRRRLLEHQATRLVFEQILRRIQALGFYRQRGKQRTDSLAVLGAVAELSALELVHETLRLALRALGETDPAWVAAVVPASLAAQYAERRADYRLSVAARAAQLAQVGADGCWLLDQLARAPKGLQALAAVQTLGAVWPQHFTCQAGGPVQVRPVRAVACTELIVTPHDVGVRAGQKRGRRWRGEKVHVTETAEAGEPSFITDVHTGNAAGHDTAALPAIRAQLAADGRLPAEQVVDSGYVSGRQLAQSAQAGIDLVGPPLADTSTNGFKIADFQIDRAQRRARCPGGQVSVKWSARTERDGSAAVNIAFAAATCAACPLQARCVRGNGGRNLQLSEHYARLQARRAEAQTAAFKARLRARPAIEATLSELVRKYGLRRHRYRGQAKRELENLLKAAACNLARLARALVARQAALAAAGSR
jgi:transposase